MFLACLKLIIASEGHSFTSEQHSYYPTDGYYLPDQMNFETNPQVSTNIPSHIYSMNPTQELSYVNAEPIYLLPVYTTLVPVYVPVIQIIQEETDPNLQPQSFLSVNVTDTNTDLAHVSSINEVESSLQTLNLELNTENEEMKKSDTQRFPEGSNLCASCSYIIKDDAKKSKPETCVIKINKNETIKDSKLKKTKEGKTSKKIKSRKGEAKNCDNKNEQSSIKMESIQPDTNQTINCKEEVECKVVKKGGKVETLPVLDQDDIKSENREDENIHLRGSEEKSDKTEQTFKTQLEKTQNKKTKKSKKSSKRHKEIKTEDDELLDAYIAENSFSINLTLKIINPNAFIDEIKILVNPYTKIEVSRNVKDLSLYGEIVIKSMEEIFNQEYILTFVSIFELMLDGFSHFKLQDKLKFVVIILNFVSQNNMNNIKGDLIKIFYLALQHHKDDFESLQNFSFIANLYVKSFVVHRTGCNPSSKCNCSNDIKIINYQFLVEKLTPDWFAEYQNVYKKNKLNKLTDIKKISALTKEIIKELGDIKESQIKKYFCSQRTQFEKINIIVKEQRISFDRYVDYIDTNLNK